MQVEPMVPLAYVVIDDTSLPRMEEVLYRTLGHGSMVSNSRADAVGIEARTWPQLNFRSRVLMSE